MESLFIYSMNTGYLVLRTEIVCYASCENSHLVNIFSSTSKVRGCACMIYLFLVRNWHFFSNTQNSCMPLGIKLYGMKGEWYQCVHVLKLSETLSESFLHTNGNNVSEIVSVILKSEHRIFILVFSVYFSPCHELDRKAKSLTLASHVSLTMNFKTSWIKREWGQTWIFLLLPLQCRGEERSTASVMLGTRRWG